MQENFNEKRNNENGMSNKQVTSKKTSVYAISVKSHNKYNILPILNQWKPSTKGKKMKRRKRLKKAQKDESGEEDKNHSASLILHQGDDKDIDRMSLTISLDQ